jgi:hypothetical protein
MPGREPLRTDRGDPARIDLVRLDPGVLMPVESSRLGVLRGLVARAAWRLPAAVEEMRLLAHPGAAVRTDPAHAFYRPDEVVDESGDGGPVDREYLFLPPH